MSGITNYISGMKDGAFDILNKFLDLPDKAPKAWQCKALHILYDVGVIFLAVTAGSAMLGGLHVPFTAASLNGILHAVQNPGLTTIMTGGAVVAGAGFGAGLLIRDLIPHLLPEKYHNTAKKIMVVVIPPLLIAGATFLILAGGKTMGGGHFFNYHFSLSKAATSAYFNIGLMLMPLGLYTATYIPDALKEQPRVVQGNTSQRITSQQNRNHRRKTSGLEIATQRYNEMKRKAEKEKQTG